MRIDLRNTYQNNFNEVFVRDIAGAFNDDIKVAGADGRIRVKPVADNIKIANSSVGAGNNFISKYVAGHADGLH